jgi:cell division cycle 2-like protein
LNKIDEGAYGVVYRARDKRTDEIVAIKKLKLEREKEGFPITALRELSTLISLKHENIVTVKEIVYGSSLDKIYVVMEYLDHELKSILEDRKL